MFTLLGFEIALPEFLKFLQEPIAAFAVNLAAWIIVAFLVNQIVMRILFFVARQLPGDLEDIVLGILRRPVFCFNPPVWCEQIPQTAPAGE